MFNVPRLSELAESVADGATPDWASAENSATDASVRDTISRLRAVANIGRFFATLSARSFVDRRVHPILAPGTMWGALRVIEHVGCGRFGDVYRAWDAALDREVALKILRTLGEDTAETDIVNEGRLMARVRHPNVVAIHGAQRIDGVTGLWMEFVQGRTLAAELAQRGPFAAEPLVDVGVQLCQALAAVHDAGLVHRDVKAQNVLRDNAGRVVLGDFGTGRALGDPSTGSLAGTPTYVAPELFAGGHVSPHSDLYGLGVLLFHLATRAYPVVGRTLRDLRDAHARGKRTALRAVRPDLPRRLTLAIEKALDPRPEKRFESATSMAGALEACARGSSKRLSRRLLTAAAALVVAAVVSVSVWQSRRTEPAIPFAERDWVLVTAFDNLTGDTSLDGALEYALERELSNTSFVNVVPRSRIEDALRLMRKPIDTRMDATVGREVALRDGKIRALIAGRVERIGGAYSVSARIVGPADGVTTASVNEASMGARDLLAAVGRIAVRVRRELGEAMPPVESKGAALQKVATQSMRALHLYSKARGMTGEGFLFSDAQTPRAVEQLLHDALREDPDFVWALILLAHAIDAQGGRDVEVVRYVEHASVVAMPGIDRYIAEAELDAYRGRFSDNAVEATRYFDKSLAKFNAVLQLQPDHFWALSCLLNITDDLGRPNRRELIRRWVELRPTNVATLSLATRLAASAEYWADAREYATRGRSQLDLRGSGPFPPGASGVLLFPARDAWRHRNSAQALAEADALLSNPRLPLGELLFFYLGLGRGDRAEQVALRNQPEFASRQLIVVAAARGYRDGVRDLTTRHMSKYGGVMGASPILSVELVLALIDAGMFDTAHQLLAAVKQRPRLERGHPDLAELVEGFIATASGSGSKGIRLLERFIRDNGTKSLIGMRAALKLAEAKATNGDSAAAITILEEASRFSGNWNFFDATVQYVDVRNALAQIYRKAGFNGEAEAIDQDLRLLLGQAPSEHPIKKRLLGAASPVS